LQAKIPDATAFAEEQLICAINGQWAGDNARLWSDLERDLVGGYQRAKRKPDAGLRPLKGDVLHDIWLIGFCETAALGLHEAGVDCVAVQTVPLPKKQCEAIREIFVIWRSVRTRTEQDLTGHPERLAFGVIETQPGVVVRGNGAVAGHVEKLQLVTDQTP